MPSMNDLYGDDSDHEACEKCGCCISCGDCKCNTEESESNLELVFDKDGNLQGSIFRVN